MTKRDCEVCNMEFDIEDLDMCEGKLVCRLCEDSLSGDYLE